MNITFRCIGKPEKSCDSHCCSIVCIAAVWSQAHNISKVCLYLVASCIWLFSTLRTVAHQAPLSMGLSRQEYWNGLPFCSPADLPRDASQVPWIAGRFSTIWVTREDIPIIFSPLSLKKQWNEAIEVLRDFLLRVTNLPSGGTKIYT